MQRRLIQGLMAAAFTVAAPLALMALQALAATPAAGAEDTPQLVAPADGATLQTFNPQLTWSLPPGSTQYQLRLTAADGPGGVANFAVGANTAKVEATPRLKCVMKAAATKMPSPNA